MPYFDEMLNKFSFVLTVIFTLIVSLIIEKFFPWWSLGIVAFIFGALFYQKPFYSLLACFLGGFLGWFFISSYIDIQNHKILSQRISELFFTRNSPFLVIVLTGVIGGITAGLGGLTGSHLRGIVFKRQISNS